MRRPLLPLILTLLAAPLIAGDGKGQGAIVTRDAAPVYKESRGDKVVTKLKLGQAVAGYTKNGALHSNDFLFDEKDGRKMVAYFDQGDHGKSAGGWMDPGDLATFTYDGSCERNAGPFKVKGFTARWNACFMEARDAKAEALRKEAPAPSSTSSAQTGPTLAPGTKLYTQSGKLMGQVSALSGDTVTISLPTGGTTTVSRKDAEEMMGYAPKQ